MSVTQNSCLGLFTVLRELHTSRCHCAAHAAIKHRPQMRRRALRVGGGGSSSCSARACCVAEPSPPASAHAQCTPGRGIAASGGLRVFACGHSFHEACLKPQAGLRGGPQRGGSCPVCAGSGGALSGALAL
eukprot:TRINITY_DN138_c1_g1_i5.p4 TRINITY_DN138_c1_g1~~TRINITY_DN138_c1_g1_i5.p4  ORF type:complete len:131 (+),score=19.51 TRINITY_DN138_c1_g1_i5:709-1101(+)